ncbi:MAG: hypothetical protein AAF481_03130 [Acidobacteriota bacterium]
MKTGLAFLAVAMCVCATLPAAANSLDVNAAAALGGSVGTACGGSPCGLEVVMTDENNAYVQSDHPNQEPFARIAFRIDPNDVTLPERGNGTPGRFRVMVFYREQGNNPRQHLFVTLKRNLADTGYRMAILQRDDTNSFNFVGEFFLGNNDNLIEIEWDQANDQVTVSRNGTQRAQATVELSTWNVDRVRWGAIDQIDTGVSGSIYLDTYSSTR